MDELLPIGSVVYTKNVLKKIMIIGFFNESTDKETKDYIGIVLDKKAEKKYFNHSDIVNILFIGYQTRDSITYQKILKDSKDQLNISSSELEAILEVRKKYLSAKEKLQ